MLAPPACADRAPSAISDSSTLIQTATMIHDALTTSTTIKGTDAPRANAAAEASAACNGRAAMVSDRPSSSRDFLRNSRDVLLLAFSTSSSAAVMPLSIRTAETKLHVRSSISQFVIPLGATINMNGTALYQAVATVFLAQVYGIDLSLASMALVVAMAVGASIGSPATPGVGIVILAMVLDIVGIPASGIALIMGVDRILDMCRTSINVTGDLVACRLMDGGLGRTAARGG